MIYNHWEKNIQMMILLISTYSSSPKDHRYKSSKRLKNVTTLGFLIAHKKILGRDQNKQNE